MLTIEIEQLEEKLELIKQVGWLNLSIERLIHDYCRAIKQGMVLV